MELSNSNIKKFQETETPQKFFIFQETETRSNFPSSKYKKNPLLKSFLYFGKWNFLAPSLKNFLYFRKEPAKPLKQTKNLL